MAHRRARLTPYGRQLLVRRILEDGWPVPQAAASMGVSRATAYKWLDRYRAEGPAGLLDRSSRPHTSPRALPPSVTSTVLAERHARREGPHRLASRLKLPRSTVYRILRRHGESRLRDRDRCTRKIVRYERERPGELLHVDVKKLGRIPDGGGHRLHGREAAPRGRGLGYDYLHVAVDDWLWWMTIPASPLSRYSRTNAAPPVRPSSRTRLPSSPTMGSPPSGS